MNASVFAAMVRMVPTIAARWSLSLPALIFVSGGAAWADHVAVRLFLQAFTSSDKTSATRAKGAPAASHKHDVAVGGDTGEAALAASHKHDAAVGGDTGEAAPAASHKHDVAVGGDMGEAAPAASDKHDAAVGVDTGDGVGGTGSSDDAMHACRYVTPKVVAAIQKIVGAARGFSETIGVDAPADTTVSTPGLELHLPAPLATDPAQVGYPGCVEKKSKFDAGRVLNYHHRNFSAKLRQGHRSDDGHVGDGEAGDTNDCLTLRELQRARALGATIDSRQTGFLARNTAVARGCDFLIAFTWHSDLDSPRDGGTYDTWSKCKCVKVHVPLEKLMSGMFTAPGPRLLFARPAAHITPSGPPHPRALFAPPSPPPSTSSRVAPHPLVSSSSSSRPIALPSVTFLAPQHVTSTRATLAPGATVSNGRRPVHSPSPNGIGRVSTDAPTKKTGASQPTTEMGPSAAFQHTTAVPIPHSRARQSTPCPTSRDPVLSVSATDGAEPAPLATTSAKRKSLPPPTLLPGPRLSSASSISACRETARQLTVFVICPDTEVGGDTKKRRL